MEICPIQNGGSITVVFSSAEHFIWINQSRHRAAVFEEAPMQVKSLRKKTILHNIANHNMDGPKVVYCFTLPSQELSAGKERKLALRTVNPCGHQALIEVLAQLCTYNANIPSM